MAMREIRIEGDPVLRKKSRDIVDFDDRLKQLVEDMTDTMYYNNGVGLAAPQVGVLRRVVVIDVGDGLITLINPKIISSEGEDLQNEGCLSVPGKTGEVKRPFKATVEAQDLKGKKFKMTGEGLLTRAFCHETDHLDGVLFVDRALILYDDNGKVLE